MMMILPFNLFELILTKHRVFSSSAVLAQQQRQRQHHDRDSLNKLFSCRVEEVAQPKRLGSSFTLIIVA